MDMRTKLEEHQNTYSEHVVKVDKMETEAAKELTVILETALVNLECVSTEFNKNTGKNLKFLAATES